MVRHRVSDRSALRHGDRERLNQGVALTIDPDSGSASGKSGLNIEVSSSPSECVSTRAHVRDLALRALSHCKPAGSVEGHPSTGVRLGHRLFSQDSHSERMMSLANTKLTRAPRLSSSGHPATISSWLRNANSPVRFQRSRSNTRCKWWVEKWTNPDLMRVADSFFDLSPLLVP